MKLRLAAAAAKRLDEHRTLQTGPLAMAQKMLWQALLAGDIKEASRQAGIVQSIRGPQPPSPLALKLIERLNRMAAENKIIEARDEAGDSLRPREPNVARGCGPGLRSP
jgi:hypothetical protein